MWRLVIRSFLLAVLVQATAGAIQNSDTYTSAEPQQLTITRNLTSMPLAFTETQGQWDERVKYRANTGGAALWITSEGVYYQFTRWIPVGQDACHPDASQDHRGPDLQEMSVSGYKQPDLQTDYGGLNGEC